MTIPSNNFDRQAEAYAFLRGALSRCDQEGCAFLDVIQVVKSWADTKNIVKKQPEPNTHVRYVVLTKESPFPPVGSKVMISKRAIIPQQWNDKPGDILVVEESGPNVVWVDSGHMYNKTELYLVVEE